MGLKRFFKHVGAFDDVELTRSRGRVFSTDKVVRFLEHNFLYP